MRVNPTRSELLELRKKGELAKKGHDLLKKKQDVLLNEFFLRVEEYKKQRGSVQQKVKAGYSELIDSIAFEGIFESRSIAYTQDPRFELAPSKKNLMGVKLKDFSLHKKDKHAEGSPLMVMMGERFMDILADLVNLASLEAIIRQLSEEIKKVRRRVNSLEHIQIPRINETKDYIQFVLEENERDNFSRLKTIK
ncbi:MAG: V-type ATP synthase subunit D [Candidatus Woesearchaeota archaeon]